MLVPGAAEALAVLAWPDTRLACLHVFTLLGLWQFVVKFWEAAELLCEHSVWEDARDCCATGRLCSGKVRHCFALQACAMSCAVGLPLLLLCVAARISTPAFCAASRAFSLHGLCIEPHALSIEQSSTLADSHTLPWSAHCCP